MASKHYYHDLMDKYTKMCLRNIAKLNSIEAEFCAERAAHYANMAEKHGE